MSSNSSNTKTPFDKKKWRTKKYSKKQKIQEWDERRKKAVIKKYFKELNESNSLKMTKTRSNNDLSHQPTKRLNPYKEAQERYKQIQEDKKTRRLEALKRKEEIRQAMEEYNKKKRYKNKKLSKKTRKGQPVMKERLELLLEKIEADVCNNTS
ncbi:thyroid transcription factor 1-associated protein 26 homolog [Daktulosphaira vitifoliae]|uniref:thyroid transcription factor 1-associated protein 26 homolog n=1 Tax=Daktulosphaira vitifoliae TaxID=58002 RepID=UPI0021A9B8B4|nr:thyroid transcription factor 1-associated protein 26 homolog [Daktulosphaira vitifoliae]XP_050537350.1 thyroid transcription factor 1-associated protein 26 homolog [Daktulosphaira vitifoliae]